MGLCGESSESRKGKTRGLADARSPTMAGCFQYQVLEITHDRINGRPSLAGLVFTGCARRRICSPPSKQSTLCLA